MIFFLKKILIGYIINYRGDEREWTSEQIPLTNTHQINEIKCGTKYSVYLNAFNEAGRSESSEMVMVKTQGTGLLNSKILLI